MNFKIKGLDQVTAWVGSIVVSGVVAAAVMWTGKCSLSRENAEKVRLAKSAEEIFAESSARQANRPTPKASKQEDVAPTKGVQNLFGYSGTTAPWRWAELKPEWKTCQTGKKQSPIDISGAQEDTKLKALKFHYQYGVSTISFENSTVSASVEPGSWLDLDGERYDLKKVTFRTPGEHRINGLPYEMEMQYYHEELSGRKLLLSIQLTKGKSEPDLKRIASQLPRFEGETSEIERMQWSTFLPIKKTYWTYRGSLTTPPCTEDVTWVIFTHTMTAAIKEIDAFSGLQKDNVRPTQTLGGRRITRSNR